MVVATFHLKFGENFGHVEGVWEALALACGWDVGSDPRGVLLLALGRSDQGEVAHRRPASQQPGQMSRDGLIWCQPFAFTRSRASLCVRDDRSRRLLHGLL